MSSVRSQYQVCFLRLVYLTVNATSSETDALIALTCISDMGSHSHYINGFQPPGIYGRLVPPTLNASPWLDILHHLELAAAIYMCFDIDFVSNRS